MKHSDKMYKRLANLQIERVEVKFDSEGWYSITCLKKRLSKLGNKTPLYQRMPIHLERNRSGVNLTPEEKLAEELCKGLDNYLGEVWISGTIYFDIPMKKSQIIT